MPIQGHLWLFAKTLPWQRLGLRFSSAPSATRPIVVADDASLAALLDVIQGEANTNVFKLYLAWPKKSEIQLRDLSKKLSSVPIKHGDLILVESAPEPAQKRTESTKETLAFASSRNNDMHMDIQEKAHLDAFKVKQIPDDNSCLFTAIGFLLEKNHGLDHGAELRQLAAGLLLTSGAYSSAMLGQPVKDYSAWIQRPNSWGGAIELALFSTYYGVQIVSIDIKTLRFDVFGQGGDHDYLERVYLLYSGIHYDAVYCCGHGHAKQECMDRAAVGERAQLQTRFSVTDDLAASAALRLAAILQDAHQFTDTTGFSLRCSVCQEPVRGQLEAQSHAKETGHVDFEEYNS